MLLAKAQESHPQPYLLLGISYNFNRTIAFGIHMQLDASPFMRNISLLHLQGV